MTYPIPPLNPLRTFEAAARLCSLTAAADELHVSQVAVSRQVKVLEEYLGVKLFRRLHRGIELTHEGKELYQGIGHAFQDIGLAARQVSRRGRRDILSIQSYTTFSQRWLIPRLAQFHAENEGIEVRLTSSLQVPDFETQNVDAAIRSGYGNWPGLNVEKLVDIELLPICSRHFFETNHLLSVNNLTSSRLLHSTARPHDWESWIKATNSKLKLDPTAGLRFDTSALAYEAASMDIGVAMAVKVFVERQLQNGSFVAPFNETCKTGEGYYLVWPQKVEPSRTLLKFLAWMKKVMAESESAVKLPSAAHSY